MNTLLFLAHCIGNVCIFLFLMAPAIVANIPSMIGESLLDAIRRRIAPNSKTTT
jgi:hypothetical protein